MLKAQADEYNHGGYTESETESDFETLDNSSANLSESTNQTTAREIAAANRTLAIAKEEGADPGAITEAEAKLDEARVAYQAGLEDLAAAPDCCNASASLSTQSTELQDAISARQQATDDFIDAYRLALTAIRILDDAGVERLEIESPRAAPPESTTANITVAANIYVPTKEEVDQVQLGVSADDSREFVVDVRQPDTPPGNATMFKRVEVTDLFALTAIAESETDDESGPDRTVPVGWERIFFDGDGLPDEYERSASKTSIASNDSDSTATEPDEANNGIPDHEEDFDIDGLRTEREAELGTDPVTADTDSDNLTDGFELYLAGTDPLAVDSDQDGILDGLEDPDGDGLTHDEEESTGTDPRKADSDGDHLLDPDELEIGTDPFEIDTDGDGLLDGTEPEAPFNTDPLIPDTDGDGVVDGQETYTTSRANSTEGVTVEVTGNGNVAAGVSIENGSRAVFERPSITSARAGGLVEITAESEFDSAELTFSYDESTTGDESDLAVFRFNESAQTFVEVNSTVDPVNDTVAANVSHFSTYTVLNETLWHSNFDTDIPDIEYGFTIIQQNGREVNVTALSYQNQSVEEFYDLSYGGSDTSTDIERSDRSLLFLWNSSGNTSLVMIHDTPSDDGSGGAVTFTFQNLPTTAGEWVVQDDPGEFDSNSTTIDWAWKDYHNDGGAFRGGLNGKFNVSLDPAFNDAATRDPQDPGSITRWEALSGDATSPNRTTLNVSKTTYIQSVPTNDADNDGLSDKLETEGIPVGFGVSIQTNASNPDTDGDGLEDGNETLQNEVVSHPSALGGKFYRMRSDPTDPHTDDDLLNDSKEVRGWNVSTINKTVSYNGTTRDIYRWDYSNKTPANITVTADPKNNDTDADGVHDGTEKRRLHTHPRRNVTYGLTLEHQRDIVDAMQYDPWTRSSVRRIGITSDSQLEELRLTDETDDFDLVYDPESTATGLELLIYRSYPSELNSFKGNRRGNFTRRTDTWLNNTDELSLNNPRTRTESVWDPDIDDDGLTDGQEADAITSADQRAVGQRGPQPQVRISGSLNNYDTSPEEADTDGDGYWDGWVGVYNVSLSRNVILYPENLKDGDGIEAGEHIDEQVGTHRIAEAPTPTDRYAVIDGEKRHSNLYLGELHWETDPTDSGDNADQQTELTFEVDYHAQADSTATDIFSSQGAVHQTYALYGVDIQFVIDDEINNSELNTIDNRTEARFVEDTYHNQSDSTAYFFITSDWAPGDVEGKASSIGDNFIEGHYGAFLFTAQNQQGTTHNAKTSVHEIGHLLGTGRFDDTPYNLVADIPPVDDADEVYSGGTEDRSPERVELEGRNRILWSAMTSGWNDPVKYDPMKGEYITLSIEEVLEFEFEEIDSKDD
jgi:hypothetical protein